MKEDEHSRLKKYAYRLLSFRLRTTFELEEKLRLYAIRCHIPLAYFPPVVEEFTRLDIINDQRYAENWIVERRKGKYRGDLVIEKELAKKGIRKEIVEEAFKHLSEEEFTENDAAVALLNKKFHRYKHLPKMEAKKKLTDLLLRHGFKFDEVYNLVDSMLRKEYTNTSKIED